MNETAYLVDTPARQLRAPSAPHPAIYHNHDILTHVFSHLDPWSKEGRIACVGASRVCWAWNVPASIAICDARPRWDLYDLFYVLFPNTPLLNTAGMVDIEKMKGYLREVCFFSRVLHEIGRAHV